MVNSFFRQKGFFSLKRKRRGLFMIASKKIQQYSIDDINDSYLETKKV